MNADVIVLGLGGMGTATAWQLARRGVRVLGLEQFGLGHVRGSSHGHSRIIRQAYYEHPAYVPLVRRASAGWYELEQAIGRVLMIQAPCLTLGPGEGELITGVRRAATEHQIPVEELSADEVVRRYPAFASKALASLAGVVEPSAGILLVDDCVRALIAEARRLGAQLHANEAVLHWYAEGDSIVVQTARQRYQADRLVVTAGPWAGALLGNFGQSLRVMRQVALWFHPGDPSLFRRDRFPVFIADTPRGYFYGLPALDSRGVKVAQHYGAEELDSPATVRYEVLSEDEIPVRGFLQQYLPDADGPLSDGSVCLYTLSPDRHFLVGLHPTTSGVALAAGFSGHGFKFAPVIGEILADLVLTGRTEWPIDLFDVRRFSG